MARPPENRPRSANPVIPAGFPVSLEPGEFHLSPERDDRIRAASGAGTRIGDEAHPIFGFVAALGGIGIPIGDVFTQFGGSIAAGPLLAAATLRYDRPLKIGVTYQISGQVLSVVRKPSRRFGQADHLTLRIDVGSRDGPYSDLTLTIIMPLGDQA